MKKIDPELHERLAKLISSMGYELIGCELLSQGRQMVFRIYIDSPKGVTIDDCSSVSYQVSAMMDVEDPLQGRYSLEVSSPGINRPLFELGHYQKQVGSRVKIRLYSPINQRKQYKGVLKRVEDENIYLLVEDSEQEVVLPFSTIEKGNVIGDIRFQKSDAKSQKTED
ncbi:Ribosome maturation factor RimP [Aquicella lusitana]|uniref:Ribosome maturation factor RimP n=2 Tax=Aquicella lusitana TaxID=254246 RepID=A0A370GFJ7_9COXI|nr:ribosome maturation factor RimP [Aquicella lusitana]RDI42457.1 ribosome maturation factor RimP [Aquicella lusitana]VVC74081.1 Ribosome maturation factor RimP [Aquicella lusitana]